MIRTMVETIRSSVKRPARSFVLYKRKLVKVLEGDASSSLASDRFVCQITSRPNSTVTQHIIQEFFINSLRPKTYILMIIKTIRVHTCKMVEKLTCRMIQIST